MSYISYVIILIDILIGLCNLGFIEFSRQRNILVNLTWLYVQEFRPALIELCGQTQFIFELWGGELSCNYTYFLLDVDTNTYPLEQIVKTDSSLTGRTEPTEETKPELRTVRPQNYSEKKR